MTLQTKDKNGKIETYIENDPWYSYTVGDLRIIAYQAKKEGKEVKWL